jgi:hypothetical protein
MRIKALYIFLFIIGTIIPYYFFLPFIIRYGLNIPLIITKLSANNVSLFFGLNVLITTIIFITYIIYDQKKIKVEFFWFSIIATLTIGISSGLPLYLYFKERTKQFLKSVN